MTNPATDFHLNRNLRTVTHRPTGIEIVFDGAYNARMFAPDAFLASGDHAALERKAREILHCAKVLFMS